MTVAKADVGVLQDSFRSVMRVELSVSEDLEAPAAAKALNEEVKVVKGWLIPLELFGAPQMLTDEPLPTTEVPTPEMPVGEQIGVSVPVVGDVGSNKLMVSQPPFSAIPGCS
jgi:hypothetical protein